MATKTIVIVGPTASGKTGVGVELAQKVGGEVISADSRAIYRGMDIGTAKPTRAEMRGVPHWGLDLVEPGERFTVADWKEYALGCVREIRERGHVPIVVGGTGLYVDALVYDYQFTEAARRTQDDRRKMREGYVVYGVATEPEVLRQRIRQRIEEMWGEGLFKETRRLVAEYGWGSQAMKSDIYRYVWEYLEGKCTEEEAKEKAFYQDWHLAKRQMTWFKRNPEIKWLAKEKIVSLANSL